MLHFTSAALAGAVALLPAGCATLSNTTTFSVPGVVALTLGEGSEITEDCRIDNYTESIIDHHGGQILGCIRFPTADNEDDDYYWGPHYCEQLGRQGWTAVWPPDEPLMCVYRRPTAHAGCFESLSFEYGMAEREIDDPDFWKAPALHTFAVVLGREYCPTQRQRARLPLQLHEGDIYCEGLTPLTTCIALGTSSEAEAQQRAAYYERQLESHGWQPLLTGNQFALDIEDSCRAIVAVGVAIRPDMSIDWSELNFIYSARCEDRSE